MEAQGNLFGTPQLNIFDEGLMAPSPAPRPSTPDPAAIRERLDRLLGTLRVAEAMPFSERDARMWAAVVPNMTKWLPETEAQAVRDDFAREMERLGAPA